MYSAMIVISVVFVLSATAIFICEWNLTHCFISSAGYQFQIYMPIQGFLVYSTDKLLSMILAFKLLFPREGTE